MRDRAATRSRPIPNGMIEEHHPSLSVGAQCRLLSISRSSFYYELMGETEINLDLMVMIDKQFLEPRQQMFKRLPWGLGQRFSERWRIRCLD